jgi:hypothetical protein
VAIKISDDVKAILKKYNLNPNTVLWDCHGTAVMYHKYIEQIANIANIQTTLTQVILSTENTAVIAVEGRMMAQGTATMGDRMEWSFGEASPRNNKNAYPYAMAEKRAKDRVILKLVGLAGHIYSEDEVADKDNKKNPFEVDEWKEWREQKIKLIENSKTETEVNNIFEELKNSEIQPPEVVKKMLSQKIQEKLKKFNKN